MDINLVEIWSNMGLAVHSVVILLTIQAVACVGVVIDRLWMLYTSGTRARAFAADVESAMEAREYSKVLEQVKTAQSNHLSSLIEAGVETFVDRKSKGDEPKQAAEYSRRALDRKGEAISRDLNKFMNVLASTGSTAPFVGLLGTVLGIINAFKLISATGSGGIGTIGAAIGEALVVTGYGLMVAIPSVLLFNWLSGKIAEYESGLLTASGELVDRLEQTPHKEERISQSQPPISEQEFIPETASGTQSSKPPMARLR